MPFPDLALKEVIFWGLAILLTSFTYAAGQAIWKRTWYSNDRDRRKHDLCDNIFKVQADMEALVNAETWRANKYIPMIEKHEIDIALNKQNIANILLVLERIEKKLDDLK